MNQSHIGELLDNRRWITGPKTKVKMGGTAALMDIDGVGMGIAVKI